VQSAPAAGLNVHTHDWDVDERINHSLGAELKCSPKHWATFGSDAKRDGAVSLLAKATAQCSMLL
jgi:hypothetical protein